MSEGLIRTISIVSIALTVVSLSLAIVFIRKKTKIRVGFDLARAIIAVSAILVMAAVTNIATSMLTIVLAVLGGLVLGFGQGSRLEISRDDRGFHARRSPAAIALWGVGIVIMQAAGIASRTGAVRLGQTIAWFSACLGIGLMAGRTGPLKRTAAGVVAAVTACVLLLLFPAIIGPQRTATAQAEDPLPWVFTGEAAHHLVYTGTYGAQQYEIEHDSPFTFEITLNPTGGVDVVFQSLDTVSFGQDCTDTPGRIVQRPSDAHEPLRLQGTHSEGSFRVETPNGAFLEGTYDAGRLDATIEWQRTSEACQGAIATDGTLLDGLVTWGSVQRTVIQSGRQPQGASAVPEPSAGATQEPPAPSVPLTPGVDSTVQPDGSPPSPGSETQSEPVDPEDAARQAIAGLIAAVAIGLVSWGEAGANIDAILSGLPGRGGGEIRTVPTDSIDPHDQTPLATDPTKLAPRPPNRRTVVISGADAEAIISGGTGSTIDIPTDQRWDVNISVDGNPAVVEGRVGSVGVVRSVGPVVRGPDGAVSVSVEVDAFDPPPPPPITETPPLPATEPAAPPPPPLTEPAPPLPPSLTEPAPPRTASAASGPSGEDRPVYPGWFTTPTPPPVAVPGMPPVDPAAATVPDGAPGIPPVDPTAATVPDGAPGIPPVDPTAATVPDGAPGIPPVDPTAGRVRPQPGFNPDGRVLDTRGNHIGYWDPNDVDAQGRVQMLDLNRRPCVPVIPNSDAGVVGVAEHPGSPTYVTHDESGTRGVVSERAVGQAEILTRTSVVGTEAANGDLLDAQGRVIGRRGPDVLDPHGRSVPSYLDSNGNPVVVVGLDGQPDVRIIQNSDTMARAPIGDGVRREWAPATEQAGGGPSGADRVDVSARRNLSAAVRAQWDLVGAGPSGELYSPQGSVIGHIDGNGKMWRTTGPVPTEITGYRGGGPGQVPEFNDPNGPDTTPAAPADAGAQAETSRGILDRMMQTDPHGPAGDPSLAPLGDGSAPRTSPPPDYVRDGLPGEGAPTRTSGPDGPPPGPRVETTAGSGTTPDGPAPTTLDPQTVTTTPDATTPVTADAPGSGVVPDGPAPTTLDPQTVTTTPDATTPVTADAPGSRGGVTASRVGSAVEMAGNWHQNVTQHGMGVGEGAGVGIGQTVAGNVAMDAAAGTQAGLTMTPSMTTNVGGALAAGSLLPNGLDNLMPDRAAANAVRTVYQGGQAVFSDDPASMSDFADGIRARDGFDPFKGFVGAADELTREDANDATTGFHDHSAVALDRATEFQEGVASGTEGNAVLRGWDHIARGAADTVHDPGHVASDLDSTAREIAADLLRDPSRIKEWADHFQTSAMRGDSGMVAQGYADIAHELGRLADDPSVYGNDVAAVLGELNRDLADYMGW